MSDVSSGPIIRERVTKTGEVEELLDGGFFPKLKKIASASTSPKSSSVVTSQPQPVSAESKDSSNGAIEHRAHAAYAHSSPSVVTLREDDGDIDLVSLRFQEDLLVMAYLPTDGSPALPYDQTDMTATTVRLKKRWREAKQLSKVTGSNVVWHSFHTIVS